MSMSTKDYRIIAEALAEAKREIDRAGPKVAVVEAFDTVVDCVARALNTQHTGGYSFNRELFMQVANGKAPVNARQAR